MKQYLRLYWPEGALLFLTVFFAFRELGTFPSAWLDDSLFMLVAHNLAEGRGYTLPVLTENWHYPYLLGVGPTVIWPAALSIKIFGFSVAIARFPFALLLCATVVMIYQYVRLFADKVAARMSAGLLISFSAFVNTGKPVLGEIPAFLFLLLGLYLLFSARSSVQYAMVGILFGVSVISKITYGILYPALGVVGIILLLRRQWGECVRWLIVGVTSVVTFGVWRIFEMMSAPGAFMEILQYGLAEGGSTTMQVLRTQPELLLRFQYVYFGVLVLLFCIGLWRYSAQIGKEAAVFCFVFVALFILYFLNGPGWYRHLLPAHLVMIPFVFLGARSVLGKNLSILLLLFFISAQGWWQFDHRGSTKSDEVRIAATTLMEQYAATALVVRQPEIYIHLPFSEKRFFLSEEMNKRNFVIFEDLPLTQEEYCLPLVQKISTVERGDFGDRLHQLYGRYVLIDPPQGCISTL